MNLKKLRKNKHIAAGGVAKDIKVGRSTFERIEEGRSDLPTRCIPILSELYGVSPEIIIRSHLNDLDLYKEKHK